MLTAPVHKDLTKYEAKVVAGLTGRTLLSIVCAIGASVAVGAYCYLVLGIGFEGSQWLCYAVSLPFWAIGFIRPMGMRVERWFPLWWRHEFGAERLAYTSRNRYIAAGLIEEEHYEITNPWAKFRKQRAVELWSPGDGMCDDEE